MESSFALLSSMEAFATPYPIYFQDDDGEAKPCGHIGVHSVLTFKRFQAIMSQKTNLPANQLSAVFVCRRMVRSLSGQVESVMATAGGRVGVTPR